MDERCADCHKSCGAPLPASFPYCPECGESAIRRASVDMPTGQYGTVVEPPKD